LGRWRRPSVPHGLALPGDGLVCLGAIGIARDGFTSGLLLLLPPLRTGRVYIGCQLLSKGLHALAVELEAPALGACFQLTLAHPRPVAAGDVEGDQLAPAASSLTAEHLTLSSRRSSEAAKGNDLDGNGWR
jgi:hypothetical protein